MRIATSIRRIAYVAAVAASATLPPVAAAATPGGFIGSTLDGPAVQPAFGRVRLAHELDVMRRSGVETVRVPWRWAEIQPYASWEAVPDGERRRLRDVGGLPMAVGAVDELVGLAARRGLQIMPVVVGTPSWIARRLFARGSPPRSVAPYARFLRALVGRYGSHGTFWRGRARLPVRWWQLWNEPHLRQYWADEPWAPGYAALLRAGARAVHGADRAARVVLAGLGSDEVAVWDNVDAILAEGAGTEVDMVAAHIFTGRPANVVRGLRRVRTTLDAYGLQRMPIALTEWTWPSGGTGAPWATTARGQAARVAETLRRLGRARRQLRLRTAIHYTWLDDPRQAGTFAHSGLRRIDGRGRAVAKPALAAFRRAARALRR